jgi:short-subunit dehydrogenase
VHCVITGAADGIGRSLTKVFGRNGYEITGVDVDDAQAKRTQAELQAEHIRGRFLIADLSIDTGVDACVDALVAGPPIDVLIHNAGINAVGRLPLVSLESQLRVVDVNLAAPMMMTAGLLNARKLQVGGTIVLLSSLSHYVGYPGASVYAATKDGIASYGRSLRVALRPNQINVMTVFPGPTRTEHARRYSPDNSREGARMDPEVLAGRIFVGMQRRRRHLIPGVLNNISAFIGRWLPSLAEGLMVRAILNRVSDSADRVPK